MKLDDTAVGVADDALPVAVVGAGEVPSAAEGGAEGLQRRLVVAGGEGEEGGEGENEEEGEMG